MAEFCRFDKVVYLVYFVVNTVQSDFVDLKDVMGPIMFLYFVHNCYCVAGFLNLSLL